MKKIRILTLASVFAFSGLMTGCFEDGSNESPTLSGARLDNAALTADGTSATTIRGSVSDDAAGLKVTFKVLNSESADKTSDFDITFTQVPSADKDWSIGDPAKGNSSIKAKTSAANGTYTLVITVTDADGAATSANVTMTVTGGSTTPTFKDTTVTLGGTSSSYGSYLDADAMKVYKSSEAAANASAIDLVFNNTSDNKNEVRSPSDASWLTWSPKNTTKVLKVTATFESITTQAAIDALYNSSTASTTLQGIVANDVLVVHTSANKNVLIKVTSITNSGAATVEFAVKGYK